MTPSKMSPEQLRLAIAEIVNDCICSEIGQYWSDDGRCPDCGKILPKDYPCDPTAALGLLIDKKITYTITQDDVSLYINDNSPTGCHIIRIDHDNTLAGIARAICEAWLTARRNDGPVS